MRKDICYTFFIGIMIFRTFLHTFPSDLVDIITIYQIFNRSYCFTN